MQQMLDVPAAHQVPGLTSRMRSYNQGWGLGDARRMPRLSMPWTSCISVRVEGAKNPGKCHPLVFYMCPFCSAIKPPLWLPCKKSIYQSVHSADLGLL